MRIKFKRGRLGEWTDWFEIRPGFDYADNYNETLDDARINIDHLENELDIEPYDIAKIEVYDGYVYYMVVDNYIKQQISFTPDIFNYEIKLMSPTKLLENYILSSFSITKKDDMTGRTIKYYADKLLLEAQYLHVKFAGNIPFRFGTLDNEILNTIVSEVQMNEPTLREALNNLFMQVDRLVVIRDFDETNNQWIITNLAINVTGSELVDKHNINYIEESQQSSEYVSDIKINMQNATQSEIKTPVISYRNEDRYIMSTHDLRLYTDYPIWKINKFSFYGFVQTLKCTLWWHDETHESQEVEGDPIDIGLYFETNLTRFVSEYGLWQTKDVKYGGWGDNPKLDTRYRNSSLFYKRGERGIFNFEAYQEWKELFIPNASKFVYEMLFNYVKDHMFESIPRHFVDEAFNSARSKIRGIDPTITTINYELDGEDFKHKDRLIFKIQYVPLYNSYMLANKKPFGRNVRQIVDNQETQLIDITKLGLMEYLKANRLGNKIRIVNARYELDEYDLIPQLAQKINGSIIFKRELKVMNDYIIANYYTTDNYVLRDYYTGVRSRLRSWKTTVNEDLIKHIHFRFYGNTELEDYNDGINLIPANYSNIDELYNLFKDATCCVQTDITDSEYGNNKVMLLEHTTSKIGNSILITFKLKDNATTGKYISDYSGTGGQEQKDYRYADNFGECSYFYIRFGTYTLESTSETTRAAKEYPLFYLNDITDVFFKLKYEYQKDNKEAPQFTLQFDFNEDATDIFYNNK